MGVAAPAATDAARSTNALVLTPETAAARRILSSASSASRKFIRAVLITTHIARQLEVKIGLHAKARFERFPSQLGDGLAFISGALSGAVANLDRDAKRDLR